jgi:hypothetical protein
MAITNRDSGTDVHEIADRIYRVNTPVTVEGGPGAFSFNQYLIVDDEPLLFHTGPRKMFPLVREAVGSVMPPDRLRYIAFSHVEADECGSLNEWLATARARCLCAARSQRWYRSTISPTGPHGRSAMARRCRSANIRCAGSIRRICRTRGNAVS